MKIAKMKKGMTKKKMRMKSKDIKHMIGENLITRKWNIYNDPIIFRSDEEVW